MTAHNSENYAGGRQCDGLESARRHPEVARMFWVACGRDQFTPEERAWFDLDPKHYEDFQRWRATILERRGSKHFAMKKANELLDGFAERLEGDSLHRELRPPAALMFTFCIKKREELDCPWGHC